MIRQLKPPPQSQQLLPRWEGQQFRQSVMATVSTWIQRPCRADRVPGTVAHQADSIPELALQQRRFRRQQKVTRPQGRQRLRAFVGAEALARGCPPGLGQGQLLLQPTAAEINADQPGRTFR